jgi:hypothetical protein
VKDRNFLTELKRRNVYKLAVSFVSCGKASPLLELACVLMGFDHIARFIVNANHSSMSAAEKLCVANCVADRVWLAVPKPTEWQRVGNQINASMIFARVNFVNVHVCQPLLT